VTCGYSGYQGASEYSLISPPRTGFRWIGPQSRLETVRWPPSCPPSRVLYWRVGEVFVVAAVGPEAQSDPRGFERAVRRALQRLADLEED
jgi:hypothetical protein